MSTTPLPSRPAARWQIKPPMGESPCLNDLLTIVRESAPLFPLPSIDWSPVSTPRRSRRFRQRRLRRRITVEHANNMVATLNALYRGRCDVHYGSQGSISNFTAEAQTSTHLRVCQLAGEHLAGRRSHGLPGAQALSALCKRVPHYGHTLG